MLHKVTVLGKKVCRNIFLRIEYGVQENELTLCTLHAVAIMNICHENSDRLTRIQQCFIYVKEVAVFKMIPSWCPLTWRLVLLINADDSIVKNLYSGRQIQSRNLFTNLCSVVTTPAAYITIGGCWTNKNVKPPFDASFQSCLLSSHPPHHKKKLSMGNVLVGDEPAMSESTRLQGTCRSRRVTWHKSNKNTNELRNI